MTMVANYPTKKALKASIGEGLSYKETSLFGPEYNGNGMNTVVGPNEYKRKFFAQVYMTDHKITRVT